jgi:NAD/NADP transhydrogenase beta subunit
LAGGLAFLVSTIAFAKVSGIIQFYGTPWHLIKKD